MYFGMKNILKNNHNNTSEQNLAVNVWLIPVGRAFKFCIM